MGDDELGLIQKFTRDHSQDAFTELVRRHVNLVYSAALRQVGSPDLAKEVAQTVFLDLARNAGKLGAKTILGAWLYRVTRCAAVDVIRRESRRQARECLAAEIAAMNATAADSDWSQIAPLLDEAMDTLDETDRAAILLRFFENKSLRDVGAALGASDDAAQKRVSRALDRLREFMTRRGVKAGTAGLAAALTANAVQAAPAGLAFSISTAALTSNLLTTATATKIVAMTSLQKSLVAVSLAATIGAGVYEAHQNSALAEKAGTLASSHAQLAGQVEQIQMERDAALARVTALRDENAALKSNNAELLQLRNEVGQLRTERAALAASLKERPNQTDPISQHAIDAMNIAKQITGYLEKMPDKQIPELKLLTDVDWLTATKKANFDTDADVRKTLSELRSLAKQRLPLGSALSKYVQSSGGQLPGDLSQLKPYFVASLQDSPVPDGVVDAILGRYQLLHSGSVTDYPKGTWFIAEKSPVDKEYDSRAKFSNGVSTVLATGIGAAGDPDDPNY